MSGFTQQFAAAVTLAICGVLPNLALAHAWTSNTVLFEREIVRILDAHCVMCHVQGGPAFPLATYEETWLRRDAIHDSILAGRMPPWPAVPGYGRFANANDLTLREKRFIVSWVEGLGPRNAGDVFLNVLDPDAAARQEVRAQADFDSWVLGQPDLVVALPEMEATLDAWRRIVIDPGLRADVWLSALEYQPANRRATRAVVFRLADTGQWLATWTPWRGFRRLPDGTAYRLAAGARLVADVHTGEHEPGGIDAGRIALRFADPAADLEVPYDIVLEASSSVPHGTGGVRLQGEAHLAEDIDLLALWPALPSGVESIELRAIGPDGRVDVLLFALDVSGEWPTSYDYEAPIALAGGTRLLLTAFLSESGVTEDGTRGVELTLNARARD